MKIVITIVCWMTILMSISHLGYGQSNSVSMDLSVQLKNQIRKSGLYYPESVIRYYSQNGFRPMWTKDKDDIKQTWEAMMLLDCVLQFGLSYADYHPRDLIYDSLRTIINNPEKINIAEQLRFDVFLTDAIITLMNHLHYGKLNPDFSAKRIDRITSIKGFNTVDELTKARREMDFIKAILTVQPKSIAYVHLQGYMRLIKGQYVGDCYETPESEARKIAINMERLRWAEVYIKSSGHQRTTYLTCEIKEGLPVFYEDIRHLDDSLEAAMYQTNKRLP